MSERRGKLSLKRKRIAHLNLDDDKLVSTDNGNDINGEQLNVEVGLTLDHQSSSCRYVQESIRSFFRRGVEPEPRGSRA